MATPLSPTEISLRLTAPQAAQLKKNAEAWIASDFGRDKAAWAAHLATLWPGATYSFIGGACPQRAAGHSTYPSRSAQHGC